MAMPVQLPGVVVGSGPDPHGIVADDYGLPLYGLLEEMGYVSPLEPAVVATHDEEMLAIESFPVVVGFLPESEVPRMDSQVIIGD